MPTPPARRLNRAALALIALAAQNLPAAAQPLAWAGEASLGSDLSERGISLWPGAAVAQALVAVSDAATWSASLAAAKPLGGGGGSGGGSRGSQIAGSVAAYLALSPDWQAQARLAAYAYPGMSARQYDRAEATLGIAFRDLVSFEASASRLRDDEPHWYPAFDLGLRWPLATQWALAAGVGSAELPNWPGTHYRYADIGLVWRAGAWRAAVSRLGASGEARRFVGDKAGPRTALSLTLTF